MFTVVVGLDASGASSTRRPFCKRYSVMPSTDVTRVMPLGSAGPDWAASTLGAVNAAAGTTTAAAASRSRVNEARWREQDDAVTMHSWMPDREVKRKVGVEAAGLVRPDHFDSRRMACSRPPSVTPNMRFC